LTQEANATGGKTVAADSEVAISRVIEDAPGEEEKATRYEED
jgi:hypothetical protein